MMKRSLFVAVVSLGFALPVCAAETATHQFDCDTPAGHYSQWKASYAAPSARVTGTVKVIELRKEAKWNPGAHVYLHANGQLVGLILTLDSADQTRLKVSVITRGNRSMEETFASAVWKDRAVPFEVAASAGTIKLTVDGTAHVIEVPDFSPSAVALRCTAGNFLFDDVSVASSAQ